MKIEASTMKTRQKNDISFESVEDTFQVHQEHEQKSLPKPKPSQAQIATTETMIATLIEKAVMRLEENSAKAQRKTEASLEGLIREMLSNFLEGLDKKAQAHLECEPKPSQTQTAVAETVINLGEDQQNISASFQGLIQDKECERRAVQTQDTATQRTVDTVPGQAVVKIEASLRKAEAVLESPDQKLQAYQECEAKPLQVEDAVTETMIARVVEMAFMKLDENIDYSQRRNEASACQERAQKILQAQDSARIIDIMC